MNRSLRELKFCFLAALPLVCAGRVAERLNLFLIAPVAAQKAAFGRVVAYPWQLNEADSWFGEDGIAMRWRYRPAPFPTPVNQCETDPFRKSRDGSATEPDCGLEWGGGYLKVGSDRGSTWMAFDPPHIDSALEDDKP